MQVLREALLGYDYVVVAYLLLVCLVYFILLVLATGGMLRRRRQLPSSGHDDLFASPLAPSITVVASAFDQQRGIERCVRALLNLRYPNYAVIVVNDGSRDDTLGVLQRRFDLQPLDAVYPEYIPTARVRGVYVSRTEPSLTVVDKQYAGSRADALNCGINLARTQLVCGIEASSVLEPDALLRVAQPFMDQPELVVATGGLVRVANGARIERGSVTRVRLPHNSLAVFQIVEYLRAFLISRTSWSRLNGLLAISGAFGLFQRKLMLEVGGYRLNNGGEDAELVTRIHRHQRERHRPYRVRFIADPVCWTEVPETLPVLSAQRRRWQRALAESLVAHRQLLHPQYGVLGMLAYPYYLLVKLAGPVIEATGCITGPLAVLLGVLDIRFAVALVLLALGYSLFLTLSALALDEFGSQAYPSMRDLLRLCLYGAMQGVGYRQLTVLWRLEGLWQAIWRQSDREDVGERPGLGAAS